MLSWMQDKLFVSRQKLGKILTRRSTNDCEIPPENNCGHSKKMLEEDKNLSSGDEIILHVIGVDGSVYSISVLPDTSIATLKSMVLSHFLNPVDSSKLLQNFKLVAVTTKRVLDNDNSVQGEQLTSGEEILVVERRLTKPKDPLDESQKGPTQEEILTATSHLSPRNIINIPLPHECSEDFQTEFRKILISLVEVAAQLLNFRPDADEVFASIAERIETRDKIIPNSQSVRNLMEMGFAEEKVVLALRLKRNNAAEALEWLLEKYLSQADLWSSSEVVKEIENDTDDNSGAKADEKPNVVQSVAKLLALFRSLRRQEFLPNLKALQALSEIGFSEREIIEALKVTGNNQASACDWLLGERRASLQDLDTGIDPEGEIYKALLSNPQIQLGLNNPRMLLAFLSILENPQTANMWLHDADVAPVLNQIFKIYHAEKHTIAVNRHVESYSRT